MEALIITLLIAQTELADPPRVLCTTVEGPIQLDTIAPVPLKCCPEGKFIFDPNHPFDKTGKLVCVREEKT